MPNDRETARLLGLARYVGQPCEREPNHGAQRFTANRACCACERSNDRARRALNPDKERLRKREVGRRHRANMPAEEKRLAAVLYRARFAVRPEVIAARAAAKAERDAKTAARRARRELAKAHRRAIARYMKPLNDELMRERALIRQRLKSKRRRALKRGAEGVATDAEVLALLRLQRGGCAYCGDPESLHLDHKTAVACGGQHVITNLQWLCAFHNISKRVTPDADYRAAHGIPALTVWDARFALELVAL